MCFISENESSLCEVNAFPAPMCCAGDTARCDKCVETLQRSAQLPVTTQVSWIEPTEVPQQPYHLFCHHHMGTRVPPRWLPISIVTQVEEPMAAHC